jgi:hypothetical protein
MRQANKIRKRLGDTWDCAFDGVPFPPKRIRWATYRRLEERYAELQSQGMGGFMSRFLR